VWKKAAIKGGHDAHGGDMRNKENSGLAFVAECEKLPLMFVSKYPNKAPKYSSISYTEIEEYVQAQNLHRSFRFLHNFDVMNKVTPHNQSNNRTILH
jgi:hypothetical protein